MTGLRMGILAILMGIALWVFLDASREDDRHPELDAAGSTSLDEPASLEAKRARKSSDTSASSLDTAIRPRHVLVLHAATRKPVANARVQFARYDQSLREIFPPETLGPQVGSQHFSDSIITGDEGRAQWAAEVGAEYLALVEHRSHRGIIRIAADEATKAAHPAVILIGDAQFQGAKPGCPLITGRLLDEEGQPLIHQRFRLTEWVQHAASGWKSSEHAAWTDETGAFSIHLDDRRGSSWYGAQAQVQQHHFIISVTASDRACPQDRLVTLPPTIPAGRRDVGDLRLAPRPLIAAGVLLTPSGSKPKKPKFELLVVDSSPLSTRTFSVRIQDQWSPSPGRPTQPGAFEIRGYLAHAPPEARLRIRINNRFLISDWVEFTRGADDLVIESEKCATIVGKFRLPEDLHSEHAKLFLRRRSVTSAHDEIKRSHLSRTGGFSAFQLRSGLYSLGLVTAEEAAPLILREFQLSSGEALVFEMIDVTELLNRYEFRARYRDGTPLPISRMMVGRDLAGTVMGARFATDPRRARALKIQARNEPSRIPRMTHFDPREKILVELRASNGRRQRITATPGITEVTFPRVIRVSLRLPLDALDCPGLINVSLKLVPLSEGAEIAHNGRTEVMNANRHHFELPHTGRYQLDLQGTAVDESTAEVMNFRIRDAWRFEVNARRDPRHAITVPVNPALRARVLQAISTERMK